MDFNKIQPMQRDLDQSILDSKPEMTKEERFTKTLVALSVELAEVANCAEHFKFWKDNKGKVDRDRFTLSDSNEELYDDKLNMIDWNIGDTEGGYVSEEQAHKLTLVDECADALHFVLSLANQLDINVEEHAYSNRDFSLSDNYYYMQLQKNISLLSDNSYFFNTYNFELHTRMITIITNYLNYIYTLGVSHEELEQAYYDKHKVNYKRQEEGY